MPKKSPAEVTAADAVPNEDISAGDNLALVVEQKSSDEKLNDVYVDVEKIIPLQSVPMFNAADLAAPLLLTAPGAAMPARETRGRKSKYATQEERDAAKKAQDKARRGGATASAPAAPGAAVLVVIPPEAYKFSAEIIVSTMDMILLAVSDNQYKASDEIRKNYHKAWVNYLETVGKEPPPWVMLLIMSGAYALPALSTPAGQSKVDKGINKIKAWWVARFGG